MGATARDGERRGLREGLLVAARYKLVESCGTGGMGAVWSAQHLALGTHVAIKFLRGVRQDEESRTRFAREARIAARLGELSRHVVRVVDYGVAGGRAERARALSPLGAFGEPVPFIVMELLRGEDLAERMRRQERLSLVETSDIVAQLSRALTVAHEAGVVHRDIKPSNVFLTSDEDGGLWVKLMDFGIAKATADNGDASTQTGTIFGTPAYMSPEQLLGRRVDGRADLWAVAACIYRMITGQAPFGGGGTAEVAARILTANPVPPSELVPDVPPSLDAFIARGLARRREERFQTARELSQALDEVAGVTREFASSGRVRIVPELLVPPSERTDRSTSSRALLPQQSRVVPRRRGARRVAVLSAVSLLLLGSVALAAFAVRRHASSRAIPRAAEFLRAKAPTMAGSVSSAPATNVLPIADPKQAPLGAAAAGSRVNVAAATSASASASTQASTPRPIGAPRPPKRGW